MANEEEITKLASNISSNDFTVMKDVTRGGKIRSIKPFLPAWLKNPVTFPGDISKTLPLSSLSAIDDKIVKLLQKLDINDLFPVQYTVIPLLLSENACNHPVQPRDLCVSAPTGSGKTLSYVMPIVQSLKFYACRDQVLAVVVLPVQDLAVQVFEVMKSFADEFKLHTALLAAQESFADERAQLVRWNGFEYVTKAHIIVATPGRLVDHLNNSSNTSSRLTTNANCDNELDLRALKYLVLDEADQVIQELKSNWLEQLDRALQQNQCNEYSSISYVPLSSYQLIYGPRRAQKLLFSATMTSDPRLLERMNLFQPQLVLCDTIKLPDSSDNLINKKSQQQQKPSTAADSEQQMETDAMLNIDETTESVAAVANNDATSLVTAKYTLPETLSEYIVKCRPSLKPLYLLHCIYALGYRRILCFCKSVENVNRLATLIKQFKPPPPGDTMLPPHAPSATIRCVEMSSRIHMRRRKKVIQQFTAGTVDIVVCTDVLSRGMDFENVQYVIQYDSPLNAESYIHRVGRTARAGKPGTSIMFIHSKNFGFYKQLLITATGRFAANNMKIVEKELQPLVPAYEAALERLRQSVNKQHNNKTNSSFDTSINNRSRNQYHDDETAEMIVE